MLNLLFRTVLVYFSLIIFMKLMGKRQIGELQLSELIITILLSEIAASPLLSLNTSLLSAIVPIITLISLEVGVSFLITKFDILKRIFNGIPSIVISHGNIDSAQLSKLRISLNELLSELRQQQIASLSEVEYAIVEQNGRLSVIKKASAQNITREDLKTDAPEVGFDHPVITDGCINSNSLSELKLDNRFVFDILASYNIKKDDVFLMTLDNAGNISIIGKEKCGGFKISCTRKLP